MPIKLACPECLSTLSVPRKMLGHVVKCPSCNAKCRVPAPTSHPAESAKIVAPGSFEPRWSRMVFGGAMAGALLAVLVIAVLGGFWRQGNQPPEVVQPGNVPEGAVQPGIPDGALNPARPAPGRGQDLAVRARAILEANCHECHGAGGSDEGGFNFVLRRDRLVEGEKYVVPGDPKESFLYDRVSHREMPPRDNGSGLSDADIETLREWIAAGAPNFDQPLNRPFITNNEIARLILDDLNRTPERDKRFRRYFTLTNLYNAGISDDELTTYRLALAKLLNSVSWEKELVQPQPVDPAGTILSIDLRHLDWNESIWKAIVDANPYSVMWNTPNAKLCREASNCELPDIRADWFVSAAAQPPLYHEVLQIPKTLKELLASRFGLDLEKNIQRDQALRAGFRGSGVSDFNRVVERHRSPYGYFWISYDFGGEKEKDRKNIFSHPLGPGTEANRFDHDGGEAIFSLPNGMQGYMLIDKSGNRLDKAPIEIVHDKTGSLKQVMNGLACMSCHYGGIIAKADEVRPTVEAVKARFAEADDIFALYRPQAELDQVYRSDADAFRSQLEKLKITLLSRTSEPIFNMADRFKSDVNLPSASAELGLRPDELQLRLANTSDDRLAKAWAPLSRAGRISREEFIEQFTTAVERFDLGVGLNKPKPAADKPDLAKVNPPPGDKPVVTPPAPTEGAKPPIAAPKPPVETPPPPVEAPKPAVKLTRWTIGGKPVEGELIGLVNGLVEMKRADGTKFSEPLEQFSVEDQVFLRGSAKDEPEVADLPAAETRTPAPQKYDYREWLIIVGGRQFDKIDGGFYGIFIGDGGDYSKNVAYVKFIRRNGIVFPIPVPLKFLSNPDRDYLRKILGDEQIQKFMATEDPPLPPGVQVQQPPPGTRLPRALPMSSRFPAPSLN